MEWPGVKPAKVGLEMLDTPYVVSYQFIELV